MKKILISAFALLFSLPFVATASELDLTQRLHTMNKQDFSLKIPQEQRNIRLRLTQPERVSKELPQLVIIATGLYSQMDKASQVMLAEAYQQAGFATLQFNFMAHGKNDNKSDGNMENVTLSSGITDLKAVWNYAKTLSNKVNTNDICIAANSYGALVSLLALEKNIIDPESMVLISPLSLDKYKHWTLLLRLFVTLAPKLASKMFLNATPNMMWDFLRNHSDLMSKKNLLGNTAVYFLSGAQDKIAPSSDIKKWCKKFNQETPKDTHFINNTQAQYKIYDNVKHFKIPDDVGQDMRKSSVEFVKKTHALKS